MRPLRIVIVAMLAASLGLASGQGAAPAPSRTMTVQVELHDVTGGRLSLMGSKIWCDGRRMVAANATIKLGSSDGPLDLSSALFAPTLRVLDGQPAEASMSTGSRAYTVTMTAHADGGAIALDYTVSLTEPGPKDKKAQTIWSDTHHLRLVPSQRTAVLYKNVGLPGSEQTLVLMLKAN